MMRDATQTRWGVALVALMAMVVAAFLLGRAQQARRTPPPGSEHRMVRQQVLYLTLSRTEAPIIVLGDSIVEAAILPPSACGHALVNAGLSGASTASDLAGWLKPAVGESRPFAIIVSLGINDVPTNSAGNADAFAGRYEALLRELSKLTDRIYFIEIPPVEARARMTPDMAKTAMATIGSYRAALPDLARRTGATLLPWPEVQAPFTIDGVHLNAEGYRAWNEAIQHGTALACG
ncbi:SGNH/GDSL hydrolase family protein [Bradyrhizobium sp. STM 3557]|uniref:SGNH/GDSL hydrolase family protein n=1 Tax=Bradyrhizobium sp. STM 3557 TaxID=578920 RepID=UPI00388D692B